jgi:hypothetical protein
MMYVITAISVTAATYVRCIRGLVVPPCQLDQPNPDMEPGRGADELGV